MNQADQELQDAIVNTATTLAGSNAALVTPDWTSLLMQLLTQFVTSCFNNTPSSSVAQTLKNLSPLQIAGLNIRMKRAYAKNNMTPAHGKLAADTIVSVGQNFPEAKLQEAVDHINGVDKSFPDLEMF